MHKNSKTALEMKFNRYVDENLTLWSDARTP